MDVLGSYKIDLKNMRTDVMEYQFDLGHAFFDAVEGTLVKSGEASVRLKVKRTEGGYALTFQIQGTVQVPCDRCLEDMDVPVNGEHILKVKWGSEYADEGDVVTLPYEDAGLNVAWMIYEYIVLDVPLVHVHEPGHCNVDMIEALQAHRVDSSGDAPDKGEEDGEPEGRQPVDPRWENLKKMLDNN